MPDPNWTAADARRDAAEQVDEMNAAWRDEAATDRHSAFIPDDPRRPDRFDEDDHEWWDR